MKFCNLHRHPWQSHEKKDLRKDIRGVPKVPPYTISLTNKHKYRAFIHLNTSMTKSGVFGESETFKICS